ncbi:MAG: hypothetical protein AAFU85_28055 [Planctomycetota bacterium]
MPRFTILLHQTETTPDWRAADSPSNVASGNQHWDWLFETDEEDADDDAWSLLTWATDPLEPDWLERTARTTPSIAAMRLPNHRRRYLHFEGELSDGRGSVRRVALGEYSLIAKTADDFRVRLKSVTPHGAKSLTPCVHFRRAESLWRLEIDAVE